MKDELDRILEGETQEIKLEKMVELSIAIKDTRKSIEDEIPNVVAQFNTLRDTLIASGTSDLIIERALGKFKNLHYSGKNSHI
jgi:hypothetical protein